MPKPVCVPCQRFYRPKRNGTPLLEQRPIKQGALPGPKNASDWVPYKLWGSDLMVCPSCGHELLSGFSREALHDYDPDFLDSVKNALARGAVVINDC